MKAVRTGDLDTVVSLLDKNKKFNVALNNAAAVHLAISKCELTMVELMIKHSSLRKGGSNAGGLAHLSFKKALRRLISDDQFCSIVQKMFPKCEDIGALMTKHWGADKVKKWKGKNTIEKAL
eukprot:UN25930